MLTVPKPPLWHKPWQWNRQAGASMPEILITVLIISFGLLALAGMQSYAVAVNTLSGNRAIAAVQANDLLEMLKANRVGFTAGNYARAAAFNNTSRTFTKYVVPTCTHPCAANVLATHDLQMFTARLKTALPAGDYRLVTIAGTTTADLWILWAEQVLTKGINENEGTADKVSDSCPATMQTDTGGTSSTLRGLRCFYMRVSL
jgi:type IV pilus assembly protein PilV